MKPHAASAIPTVIYLLHVGVRGQLEGTGSLLLPCGFQGQIYIIGFQNSGLDKTASVTFSYFLPSTTFINSYLSLSLSFIMQTEA